MRLSPSFALTIEQCTLRARWLRIDKVDRATPDNDEPLRYGRAVHTALEKLYQHVRDAQYVGPLHTPDMIDQARTAVTAAREEHGPFDQARFNSIAQQVLDHCLEQHHVSAANILGLELFTHWGLKKGTNVVAFMDRVDRMEHGIVRVVDYKSGTRGWDESIIRSDLQMQTYAVVAKKRFPWAKRIRVTIDSTKLRRTASAQWTEEELPFVEDQLKARYLEDDAAVTDGPWEATPDEWWCGRCEFRGICPAWESDPAIPVGAWDPRLGRRRREDDDAELEQAELLDRPPEVEPHGPRVERRRGR